MRIRACALDESRWILIPDGKQRIERSSFHEVVSFFPFLPEASPKAIMGSLVCE